MGVTILRPSVVPEVPLSNAAPLVVAATTAAGTGVLGSKEDHSHALFDTGWVAPTFLNGWVDYDTTYAPARYRRIGNIVFLRGLLKNGGTAHLFTLPSGFRPQIRHLFACQNNPNAVCRIDVAADGNVTMNGPYSNVWISLNNIVFPTDQ